MVCVKNVIREMFQKTYVIRDLNENRLVIRDRDSPFTSLISGQNSLRDPNIPRCAERCAVTKGGTVLKDERATTTFYTTEEIEKVAPTSS